jgi:hypothetical protein
MSRPLVTRNEALIYSAMVLLAVAVYVVKEGWLW